MNELDQVLTRISTLRKEREQKQKLLQDGLKTNDGKMNIPLVEQTIYQVPAVENQITTVESEKQPKKGLGSQTKCLTSRISDSDQARKQLAKLINQLFKILNIYGKKPEDIADIVAGFCFVLSDYDIESVTDAFKMHLRKSSVMPTPADIVAIIEPPVAPVRWSATAFIDIKRRWREGQFITDKEKKYCESYVSAQINEVQSEERKSALLQVKKENNDYYHIDNYN